MPKPEKSKPEVELTVLTEADMEGILDVHLSAFPEAALSKFGRSAVRRYYEWQFRGPHDMTPLGAKVRDKLIGFNFAGVFKGADTGFMQKNRFFLLSVLLVKPWLFFDPYIFDRIKTALKYVRFLSRQPKPVKLQPGQTKPTRSFGILSIAVSRDAQGLGVGKKLMDKAENIAIDQGFGSMRLSVRKDNLQAIGFYEKNGWAKMMSGAAWGGVMVKSLLKDR